MNEVVQTLVEEGVLVRTDVGAVLCDHPPEGAHVSAPLQIPTTVQGVLAARIDRLTAAEKELLQQLSVVGRQFPVSLVKAVVSQTEDELQQLLASLQAKEFVYEQPAFPESEYLFKHALTQDVAYGTVLQEQRKALHERTGQAMEALYTKSLDDHYSALAHHYSHTDNAEKAVEYLGFAGQQAFQRSAYDEALRHLSRAIELIQTLPDTSDRSQHELPLQITLGSALQATKGFANPEVEQAYTRARELCEQVGEPTQIAPVLYGLWQLYILRSEHQKALGLGEQLFALAQTAPDLALQPAAQRALGEPLLWLGKFSRARDHLEHGSSLYKPELHRGQAFVYGLDTGVAIRSMAAHALWLLGYPDQALERSHQALTLAQELSHPFILAHALVFAAWIHQHRREGQAVQEQAEATLALCTEQGFTFYLALGTYQLGWALAERGQAEAGIAQMRQGLAAWRATGASGSDSYWLALLVEGCRQAGQVEEGRALLTEAMEIVHRTGERYCEAELYRLNGELILQKFRVQGSEFNGEEEAEGCFRKAIEVAQKQEAKSWELLAATSLARLWQQQGKTTEAHAFLAPVYNWFTEGFDTKDLQEAKALLADLS